MHVRYFKLHLRWGGFGFGGLTQNQSVQGAVVEPEILAIFQSRGYCTELNSFFPSFWMVSLSGKIERHNSPTSVLTRSAQSLL